MARITPTESRLILKALTKHFGYKAVRMKGDHVQLEDSKGHHTTIIANQELRQSMIKLILKDTGLEWDELKRYL